MEWLWNTLSRETYFVLLRSLHVHLRQCHLLHNLLLLRKVILWWNGKTTRWPIPRTLSRRRKTRTHPKQSLNTSSLIILSSIWHIAVFPFIKAVRKAAKRYNKNLFFKSALLTPTVSTSAFHSTNLFLFSRHHIPTDNVAPFSAYTDPQTTHNSSNRSNEGKRSKCQLLNSLR